MTSTTSSPIPRVATIAALLALVAVAVAPAAPAAGRLLDGAQLWEARYDGAAAGSDWAYAVTTSPDGLRVFVTGHSSGSGTGADYATVAYDALTGTPLWTARYDGPGSGADFPYDVIVSPDGTRVYVTGYSQGLETGVDFTTIAYDALSGLELWVARWSGTVANGLDVANAVVVSPDGARVFVTGYSAGGATSNDYATVAYDALTGAELWAVRYDGPASMSDIATDVAVAPDGSRVYVTGYGWGVGSRLDYGTIAYDAASGAELWVARYDGPAAGNDLANSVGVTPDGARVIVTGFSLGVGTSNDAATVAYDAATGAEVWAARHDGPSSGADSGWDLVVSPDGARVFVAGQTFTPGFGTDFLTLAYDTASGAELWAARYNGPANGQDRGMAIALSADGARVFAVGESRGTTTDFDYALVAYDAATGAERWVARYDHGGADWGRAVAADPLGLRVYVTGNSRGSGGTDDFATVAFLDLGGMDPLP